ncbi:hypothetical protein PQU92_12270 [Asticcacaulis sp. BYS171W]|uniref:Uncharacterized protein n=1 Tax=Asticcacaulis aquaticus TaxID=2984212 RepID=A0ABT5HVE5_9CAUL|nr:hypothetical protein [Asticcacaulis aquaticus]MDC7684056.1 hypothetical protein [Asticcacaulis aquaticus]
MALDTRTPDEKLSPEARRGHLRAFADRMLLRTVALDDPEDLSGVERAVRVVAVIERIYSRCDRDEGQAPDPHKLQTERARHQAKAVKARVHLAGTLEWGEKRRKALGPWWDAAGTAVEAPVKLETPVEVRAAEAVVPVNAVASKAADERPKTLPGLTPAAEAGYVDYTDAILKARSALGLRDVSVTEIADTEKRPPPPRA